MPRTGSVWVMGAVAALVLGAHPPGRAPEVAAPEGAAADSAEAWFMRNLEYTTRDGGRWLADNARYVGPDEPWPTYGIEWKKGLTGRTGHGRLFAVATDGAERNFWEFFTYWDPLRRTAVAIQVHPAGAFGAGDITWRSAAEHELVQDFHWPDGSAPRTRHLERASGDTLYSQSFDWKDGAWEARRTYLWIRRR